MIPVPLNFFKASERVPGKAESTFVSSLPAATSTKRTENNRTLNQKDIT